MFDYAEFYYSNLGAYPFETDKEKIQTQSTIQYMIDSKISDEEILRVLEESSDLYVITPQSLPDWLWEGSLLERGVFYYHSSLHINSSPPVLDTKTMRVKVSPFFMEIKIRYTMEDLIKYFYRTTRMSEDLADPRKDGGGFKYLMGKYSKIPFCEPLDFVLALIDEHAPSEELFSRVQSILSIEQAQADVYEKMKRKTAQARVERADRIIWR